MAPSLCKYFFYLFFHCQKSNPSKHFHTPTLSIFLFAVGLVSYWFSLGYFQHCYSILQYGVQYSVGSCSIVQCRAVQCRTLQCRTVEYTTVQCCKVQYSAVKCGAVQCRSVQCRAVQCRAVREFVTTICISGGCRPRQRGTVELGGEI